MKRVAFLATLCVGCHTLPPDGWHYRHAANTRPLYVKDDYVIIQRRGDFELVYRPSGNWMEYGAFPTLDAAKAAAK